MRARVLRDVSAFGHALRSQTVVEASSGLVAALKAAGVVEDAPAEVAFALSEGAPIVKLDGGEELPAPVERAVDRPQRKRKGE